MAPTRPGGRPCNAWNSSRRRKLIRLYTLTNLNKKEIQALLAENGFRPSDSDIQKKLRELLPSDYAKNWRRMAPSDAANMRLRFSCLRKCRKCPNGRIGKVPRKSRPERSTNRGSFRTKIASTRPKEFPDGLETLAMSDRKSSAPTLCPGLQDSPTISPSLLHDLSPPPSYYDLASDNSLTGKTVDATSPEACSNLSHSTTISKPKVSSSESATRSPERQLVAKSLRITRIKSLLRFPSNAAHIDSVLRYSSSDSFRSSIRSSIISIASLASSLKSLGSRFSASKDGTIDPTPLSESEKVVWEELVDESMLILAPTVKPRYSAISLVKRPCCNLEIGVSIRHPTSHFWQPDDCASACTWCGLRKFHTTVMRLRGEDLSTILRGGSEFRDDFNTRDYFGNLPLHFMASRGTCAVSTIISFINWMANSKRGMYAAARNSSGETFMHILSHEIDTLEQFLRLHETLNRLGLDYNTRDFHGRSITHALFRMRPTVICGITSSKEASRLLSIVNADLNGYDSLGYSIKEDFCSWVRGSFSSTKAQRVMDLALVEYADSRTAKLVFKEQVLNPQFLFDIYNWPLKLEPLSWEKKFCTWVDKNGDTLLNALLKAWKLESWPLWPSLLDTERLEYLPVLVRKLITYGDNTHEIRDREGNTPLGIATRRGLRPAVFILLEKGANIYSRSYKGVGILSQAQEALEEARYRGDDRLYANIMTCMNLLIDAGAPPNPSERDEWLSPERRAEEKLRGMSEKE